MKCEYEYIKLSEALLVLMLNIHGVLQIESFYITYTVKLCYESAESEALRSSARRVRVSSSREICRCRDKRDKYACTSQTERHTEIIHGGRMITTLYGLLGCYRPLAGTVLPIMVSSDMASIYKVRRIVSGET